MRKAVIDGVTVTADFNADLAELEAYAEFIDMRVDKPVQEIHVHLCPDDTVDITWTGRGQKFERIRRITGYLVGTIDRWNDSKQAEEHDRVKHDTRI